MMWIRSCRSSGLTLIEVLCALALLGLIASGLVVAKARLQRQAALAQQRLAAVTACDALLHEWWGPGKGIPIGEGLLAENPDLWWRTARLEPAESVPPGSQIVRLQIRSYESDQVLASADLLLAAPRPEQER